MTITKKSSCLSDIKKELEETLNQLQLVTSERDKLNKEIPYHIADKKNIMRRAEEDALRSAERAHVTLIRDLVPVFDSLTKASQDIKDLLPITDLLFKILKQHNVDAICPQKGDALDLQYHEVVGHVAGKEEVIDFVESNGYRIGKMTIKPAKVIITKIETGIK